MHIHILGICGTFMAGVAILARQLGHRVTGSDAAVYPPMSIQLETLGISCLSGYLPEHLNPAPDLVIIGNALSRGNPAVEAVFDRGLPYISGPQWLAENVLAQRWVLAVSGTHGKTTTTSMLTWILHDANLQPGFLIGGIPENFGVSARLGDAPFFVVEADEYDSAFFDKRSKFIHYRPRTLVINNIEFDHADIFENLAAIQKQFHYLVRTVPATGLIVHSRSQTIDEVLQQGCWTARQTFGDDNSDWQIKLLEPTGSHFEVWFQGQKHGEINWSLYGIHNVWNGLAAIASAHHVGVPIAVACEALQTFQSVKRRLELRGVVNGVSVYDDFAHHPTAISLTIKALRQKVGNQPLIAVLEPRSNSMRMGVFQDSLADSLREADEVLFYQPKTLKWSVESSVTQLQNVQIFEQVEAIVEYLATRAQPGQHILIMSNGGFEQIHTRVLAALST
jgi:UDP-N-acetylmuramate: L-alanyl-gamma-D-glutamyl-meso-diaminopimelate ligase